MSPEFDSVFSRLRSLLQKHAAGLTVTDDRSNRYCVEGAVGPATLRAWGGKAKVATIPVAWVEVGKAYVSYHLMGLQGNAPPMSKALKSRMQGKTCFNFKSPEPNLFEELDEVTARTTTGFRRAGFITGGQPT